MVLGMNLYINVSKEDKDLIDKSRLISFLFSTIALCTRAISKHGDKSPSPTSIPSPDVVMTLEKALLLLHCYVGVSAFHKPITKEEQQFKVETSTEIVRLVVILLYLF